MTATRSISSAGTSPMQASRLLGLILLLAVIGCSHNPEPPAGRQISVSIPPLADLVKRIGGDSVAVQILLPPGRSPATYEPTPSQMTRLADSRLLLLVGVPFERIVQPRAASMFPELTIVTLQPKNHPTGHVGHDHEDDLDPHSWLSPVALPDLADQVRIALSELAPAGAGDYRRRYQAYVRELARLDSTWQELFADVKRRTFYCYHPAYGWLAERYSLEQVAIEQAGKEPSPAQLARLIDRARADSIGTIFVQKQFADTPARAVAEAIGARVYTLEPMAENTLENLDHLIRAIAAELKGQSPEPAGQSGKGEDGG